MHKVTHKYKISDVSLKFAKLIIFKNKLHTRSMRLIDETRDGPRYKAKGARAPPGPKKKFFSK